MRSLRDLEARPLVRVPADLPACEVASLLACHQLPAVAVHDEADVLLGVVSEREVARALGAELGEVLLPDPVEAPEDFGEEEPLPLAPDPGADLTARDLLREDLCFADVDQSVAEAAAEMTRAGADLLLMLEAGRPRALLTALDVLGGLAQAPRRRGRRRLRLVA